MEEKNTNIKSKKRYIYYVIVGVCSLLLLAGIILTVYFVTANTGTPVAELPPVDDQPDDPPKDPVEPDQPSGGESVRFVAPIDYETFSVVYADIYENGTTGWWYRHKAVDFAADAGTEVRAMADGTVETVSISRELGNLVVIDHGDGLKTYYRFIEPLDSLKEGKKVTKGQKLGEVAEAYGSEAFAGEHLHLEVVLNREYVDPSDYLEPVLSEK